MDSMKKTKLITYPSMKMNSLILWRIVDGRNFIKKIMMGTIKELLFYVVISVQN